MKTFSEGLNSLVDAGLSVDRIAGFCQVNDSTVKSWLGGGPINGLNLLAVLMLLRHFKVKCEGQLTCGQSLIKTGELLILGLTNREEVCKDIGVGSNHLMGYLRGIENPSEERYKAFTAFVELRGEPLKDAIASNSTLNASLTSDPNTKVSKPFSEVLPQQKLAIMDQFGHVTSLLMPLITHLGSDTFSAEERNILREHLKRKFGIDIYTLRDSFALLLSEQARTAFQQEAHQ